jgi:hypothetical protein
VEGGLQRSASSQQNWPQAVTATATNAAGRAQGHGMHHHCVMLSAGPPYPYRPAGSVGVGSGAGAGARVGVSGPHADDEGAYRPPSLAGYGLPVMVHVFKFLVLFMNPAAASPQSVAAQLAALAPPLVSPFAQQLHHHMMQQQHRLLLQQQQHQQQLFYAFPPFPSAAAPTPGGRGAPLTSPGSPFASVHGAGAAGPFAANSNAIYSANSSSSSSAASPTSFSSPPPAPAGQAQRERTSEEVAADITTTVLSLRLIRTILETTGPHMVCFASLFGFGFGCGGLAGTLSPSFVSRRKMFSTRRSPRSLDLSLFFLFLRPLFLSCQGVGHVSELVQIIQDDLCKNLLACSLSKNLLILSLVLRIVFDLFATAKEHLKVQLEVFFMSIHLRVAESAASSFGQKELVLESLLEFCREPALIVGLYRNYDCEIGATNLFEGTCARWLSSCSLPPHYPSTPRPLFAYFIPFCPIFPVPFSFVPALPCPRAPPLG